MKRYLAFLLVVALIPVFLGVYCHCAKAAAPISGALLTKIPCHGCCGEISAAPDRTADQIPKFFSVSFSKISNVLKALRLDASQDIAINRRALVPAGDEPLFLSPQQPLYLSLQVFRI